MRVHGRGVKGCSGPRVSDTTAAARAATSSAHIDEPTSGPASIPTVSPCMYESTQARGAPHRGAAPVRVFLLGVAMDSTSKLGGTTW